MLQGSIYNKAEEYKGQPRVAKSYLKSTGSLLANRESPVPGRSSLRRSRIGGCRAGDAHVRVVIPRRVQVIRVLEVSLNKIILTQVLALSIQHPM